MARILVVDDDEGVGKIIKMRLEEDKENRCEYVKKGEMALDFLRSGQRFDVIITDLLGVGLRGYDLCDNLKSENFDIPVVCLSACRYDSYGDKSPFKAFVTKPFDPEELKDVVIKVCTSS